MVIYEAQKSQGRVWPFPEPKRKEGNRRKLNHGRPKKCQTGPSHGRRYASIFLPERGVQQNLDLIEVSATQENQMGLRGLGREKKIKGQKNYP
jgi:hypothetical protein